MYKRCMYAYNIYIYISYLYLQWPYIYLYRIWYHIYVYTAWFTYVLYTLDMLYSYDLNIYIYIYMYIFFISIVPSIQFTYQFIHRAVFFVRDASPWNFVGKTTQNSSVRSPMKNGQSLRKTSRCQTRKPFDTLTVRIHLTRLLGVDVVFSPRNVRFGPKYIWKQSEKTTHQEKSYVVYVLV